MAKDAVKTTIDANGLRYRSKASGSPFASTGVFSAATMSCFLCGKHRTRSSLKSRRFLGKTQFVCAPSCKEAEAGIAPNAAAPAAAPAATPADNTAPETGSSNS
ncbi:hypothetical protein MW290_20485 [Aquincola tertiaricarbonis]|uniref:Uncharacterized protein n=1 Tax=Aquincola tertiaricarbonis TaxID=391953 RepID=A0ABY4SJZ8_AQUTE|nr:hypothetical protein [Aquincola tertiaricarbonis]URI11331.1 hypothetical protein MW290_20485 [Aquincola tertiaricarbonis]